MGLFGKIFEKKNCDICGGEIGMLGNRKLEDGNCCKECAKKLSPWFDDRRHSTIDSIKSQLDSREKNKQAVAAFNATKKFGADRYYLFIDEAAKKFCVCCEDDLNSGNPDIIDISCIQSHSLEPDEERHEIFMKDNEGNNVSYNPKRYEYEYDFDYVINVNHPYIDKIRFRLNPKSVELRQSNTGEQVSGLLGVLAGQTNQISMMNPEYDRYIRMGDDIASAINMIRNNTQFQGVRDNLAQAQSAPAQPETWTCPSCGSVNKGKFCANCGSPRV